jgi:hypothetical protein
MGDCSLTVGTGCVVCQVRTETQEAVSNGNNVVEHDGL